MKQMIFNNILPISGGTAGALYSTTLENTNMVIHQLPQQEAIIVTIILAIIGALAGFLTGKVCRAVDGWFKKYRNKGKIEVR